MLGEHRDNRRGYAHTLFFQNGISHYYYRQSSGLWAISLIQWGISYILVCIHPTVCCHWAISLFFFPHLGLWEALIHWGRWEWLFSIGWACVVYEVSHCSCQNSTLRSLEQAYPEDPCTQYSSLPHHCPTLLPDKSDCYQWRRCQRSSLLT